VAPRSSTAPADILAAPPVGTQSRSFLRRLLSAGPLAVVALLILIGVLVSTRGGGSDPVNTDEAGPAGAPAPVQGAAPTKSIDPTLEIAKKLSRDMAAPWPKVQKANGHFRSGVGGGTRYGDSMLGFALIQQGISENDEALIKSGMQGMAFAVPRLALHSRPSIFEAMAVVGVYNLRGDPRVGNDPTFKRLKPKMEDYLRSFTLVRLPATTYYGNHWLVEAVMVQEMLKTGLHSDDKDAVVGGLREKANQLSEDLINKRIPAMAKQKGVHVDGARAFVLSDPPDDPLAYQGLSYGFYARAIRLLGPRANDAAKRTLHEIGNASLYLAAPDGDLAYFGRNQEQAWALASTAYGAEVTASLANDPKVEGRFRALAQRAYTRLRDAYGIGRFGLNITPGIKAGRTSGAKGVDGGAGGPSFGGLTLLFTDWALPEIARAKTKPTRIYSDEPGGVLLSRGDSRFAVVRRADEWYAIRVSTSGKHPEELRNDFGLMDLKRKQSNGTWENVVRLRPITRGDGDPADSAGPVLLQPNGQKAFPFGASAKLSRGGTLTMTGGWRGKPTPFKRIVAHLDSGIIVRALDFTPGVLARSGVTYTYKPTSCGVQLSFPARAGDSIEYSLFLKTAETPPQITATSVSDALSRTTFNRPATVKLEPGYASGLDGKLTRARITFRNLSAGPVRITACGR
jgi:hypothetical protein